MFQPTAQRKRGAIGQFELIFHTTVRQVRQGHRNAVVALAMNVLKTAIFVVAFFLMFQLLGLRASPIRGDFLLYLISGIFLFLTHTAALAAVSSAEGHTSPMMLHAPMNSIIAIAAAALSSLYMQTLALFTILLIYHVAFEPISIDNPVGAMGMFLAAWVSGVAIGVVFRALRPWWPEMIDIISTVYIRANMIASGKLFVANSLPTATIAYFAWNPLFHAIDQERGYLFLHYNPHYTSSLYPVYFSAIFIMIGLMIEFYTRKHASLSWFAGR